MALPAALGTSLLLLSSCSYETEGEWKRLAMPDPASTQGEHILHLWQGAWIAALITGAVVWGLIFYAVFRFRRRSDDEVPIQTRYNLPLEIFYTIAPIIMVIVFFQHTVNVQNTVLDDSLPVDNTIEVTGQQWSWTFNYGIGPMDASANDDPADQNYPYSSYVYTAGTASHIPTLVHAGRQDHPLQPALARRHPRPGRARVPDEDGRRPGPREPLRDHADPHG